MAIKIDLLPGHVKQRRNLTFAIAASALALTLVGTGLVLALDAKQKELAVAKENLAVVTAVAQQTTAAEGVKTAAESAAQPIGDTVAFMLAASKSGPQRAALLNQVRQYIYIDTVVKAIDLSDGQNAIVRASVKDPTQYAQFLFNLRRAGPPTAGAAGAAPATTDAGPLYASPPRGPATAGAAGGAGGAAPGGGGGAGGYNVKGFGNGAETFVPATPTDQPVILVYPLDVVVSGPLKYPVPAIPDPVAAGGAAGAAPGGAPGGHLRGHPKEYPEAR